MGIEASVFDDCVAVTPSDTVNDPGGASGGRGFAAIYTGSGGTIKITTPAGTVSTIVGAAAGIVLPIRCIRIWASVTTATSILGLVATP